MDSVNFRKNIEKVNNKLAKEKTSQKEDKKVEIKSTEASSLNALSAYSQAMISFKGNVSSDDLEKRSNDFKQKVKQNAYNYGWMKDSLEYIDKDNISFVEQLYLEISNKPDYLQETYKDSIKNTIKAISENIEFVRELWYSKDENGNDLFPEKLEIGEISRYINEDNIEFVRELCFKKDKNGNDLFPAKNKILTVLLFTNAQNIELARELCFKKDENGNDLFPEKGVISKILLNTNARNIKLAKELCFDKDENNNDLFPQKNKINKILEFTNTENIELARKLCYGKDENGNELFSDKNKISLILKYTNAENMEFAKELCFGKDKNGNDLFPEKDKISNILDYAKTETVNTKTHLKVLKEGEITPNLLMAMFDKNTELSLKDIKKLQSVFDLKELSDLSVKNLNIAAKMIDLANKKDINEIDLTKKKSVVRNLVSLNTELYSANDEFKQIFPLFPSNQEEYCSLLQNLSKAIGIETNELTFEQIGKFNKNITDLSSLLGKLSDKEFNNLKFEQEYPKDKFIKNTFEIVKDLSSSERQKVYDYFGFELKHNDNGTQVDSNKRHSFSIIGYPVNLNDGKKLTEIENENTKSVVEKLRPEVIKFSQNNLVSCQNKEIETLINGILELCPELRTQIGRIQHGTHSFDVFKHSLKVMQKIAQNSEFSKMNESDKKILLLASLLHDINKTEGHSDSTHPVESAFDAFYITKKFGLTKEETNKLYTLIKYHEWLGYTNSKKIQTDEEKETRIKSVAYDLHYDNLFELSKILTGADLKAVKNNDDFYNKVKDVFNTNSSKVEAFVKELKTTQPLLPVTQIPSATRIKEAITSINSDGSTNLKGIYQDNKGMVIIKFNEVENETWEKIGFPKGSVSKGIDATKYLKEHGDINKNIVNTGNIKFFAHGLDYSEQMRNFDTFTLPDSDALLSVSYMERPESKYKLFRTQGLLLDVDTKYIHGGGETDSGSGCKKSLDLFKKDYAFSNGHRYADRVYIANLIKKALNLTDNEYVEFVKNNVNKPISEIEPKEYQEPIIKAFATINSNIRRGERSYNEMFVTNPKAMGVYAYSAFYPIANVMDFVFTKQNFLKEYAIEEDVPFIVFGD